jgi:hypothetical protein
MTRTGKLPVDAYGRFDIPQFILPFLSIPIESRLFPNTREASSFDDASESLKENYFRIADGVDSDEVSAFVRIIESSGT